MFGCLVFEHKTELRKWSRFFFCSYHVEGPHQSLIGTDNFWYRRVDWRIFVWLFFIFRSLSGGGFGYSEPLFFLSSFRIISGEMEWIKNGT